MQAVKVSRGPLVLVAGQDARVLLSTEQAAARAHNVTVIQRLDRAFVLVHPDNALHFKVGETVGLDASKSRAGVLDVIEVGPLAKAAAKILEADQVDKIAEMHKAAREEFLVKAKADYAGSPDLQKQYATIDAYVAALDAEARKAADKKA